jgi:hypothetical protein
VALELIPWAQTTSDRFRAYRTGGFTRLEARVFLAIVKRLSPFRSGALRESWIKRRNQVLSDSPYAAIQDRGGRIQGRMRDLFIPLAASVRPTSPGNVTLPGKAGPFVLDRSSRSLVAVRRASVIIRGSGYLQRAEDELTRAGAERAMVELEMLGDMRQPMPPSTRNGGAE